MWRTTFTNTIATPLPPDLKPATLVHLLHDHRFLISTSPLVTRIEPTSPPYAAGKTTYEIWENIDVLPFGLWKKQISFTADFEDTADGLLSWVHAPMNLENHATYTVRNAASAADGQPESAEGEAGGMVLEEVVKTSCNVVFKWFVEMTFVPVHRKTHEAMIAKALELDRGVES